MGAQCYVWVPKNYSWRMMGAQWRELLGMDWAGIGQLEGQRRLPETGFPGGGHLVSRPS